jgi:hypothetical protein
MAWYHVKRAAVGGKVPRHLSWTVQLKVLHHVDLAAFKGKISTSTVRLAMHNQRGHRGVCDATLMLPFAAIEYHH